MKIKVLFKRKTVYELYSVIWNKHLSGMKDGSGFSEDLWNGIDDIVFDKFLLEIQKFKEIKGKISITFINNVLKCFSQYFRNIEISKYSIIPNQNNKLCSTGKLYKDNDIPEIFKDCLKNCFDEDIREELVNKEIDIKYLKNILNEKEIYDYNSTLKKYFLMSEEPSYDRYSRTCPKYMPLVCKEEAAEYLIKIVPNDSNSIQRKLFNLYQIFTNKEFNKNEYCEISIKDYNYGIWNYSNKYIYKKIRKIIEKNKNVNSLAKNLGKKNKEILKHLNIFINTFPNKGKIVPNQNLEFCKIDDLWNEGDLENNLFIIDNDSDDLLSDDSFNIDDDDYDDDSEKIKYIPDQLKEIAKHLGYDIKAKLVHRDIGRPCKNKMSYEKICEIIDELIKKKT